MMKIRPFQMSDETDLVRIHDLARPIELEGSCDPRAFVPLLEDKEDLAEFHEATKFVALREEHIVGFVGIEGSDVGWLYVDPEESGKGVGRRLLKQALNVIGIAASVYVLDGNKAAIGLYASEKFNEVDRFKSKNNGYPCTVVKLSQ
jgi:ribosomal protein S18 acetylase RimI-like enzyme